MHSVEESKTSEENLQRLSTNQAMLFGDDFEKPTGFLYLVGMLAPSQTRFDIDEYGSAVMSNYDDPNLYACAISHDKDTLTAMLGDLEKKEPRFKDFTVVQINVRGTEVKGKTILHIIMTGNDVNGAYTMEAWHIPSDQDLMKREWIGDTFRYCISHPVNDEDFDTYIPEFGC